MTFSTRDAILNDDEEWFNIPTVVRSFLRQLNNEVQGNRLTCDTLLKTQEEHDSLLKGVLSKQIEREFEITKNVLSLQQERQDSENSIRDVVDSIRLQMRHISQEQQEIREHIRQIEEREKENITINDSLRKQFNNISKTITNRTIELENLLNNKTNELFNNFENFEKNIHLISEKQNNTIIESRNEIERFNTALHQLCDAVSEEVDNLRIQLQEHKSNLNELKEFNIQREEKNEKNVKTLSRLRDKVNDSVNIIKQIESSSNDRFESVFNALEKSQALTNKLSYIHKKRGEDHSSLLSVLQETRDMHNILSNELKTTLNEQLNKNRKELEELNYRFNDLNHFKEDLVIKFQENFEYIRPDIEELYKRLNILDSEILKTNFKDEIESFLKDAIKNEHISHEQSHMELYQSISEQKNIFQSDMEYIKTIVRNLDTKYEEIINVKQKVDNVGESVEIITKQIREFEKVLYSVHENINIINDNVRLSKLKIPIEISSHNKNDFFNDNNNTQTKESIKLNMDFEINNIKKYIEELNNKLSNHEIKFNEVEQNLLRYDNLFKEIPKSYQRYIENVDQKLSPALLELDILRKRIASFEVEHISRKSNEGINSSPNILNEDDEIENMKLKIKNNQSFQLAQRQIQNVDIRLDSVHILAQSLEKRFESLSKEVLNISQITSSFEEKEQQKDIYFRNEIKRIFTHLNELEEETKDHEKNLASKQKSIQMILSDVKTLELSFETTTNDIQVIKKALKNCITVNSLEWKEILEYISEIPKSTKVKENEKQINLPIEYESFAPLTKVLDTEESLIQLQREQSGVISRLEQLQKLILEKDNMELVIPTSEEVKEFIKNIEKRVNYLEESLCKNNSQMFTNVNDLISSLEIRINSIGMSLNELQIKQNSILLPSSSDIKDTLECVTVLQERLNKLESTITSINERKVEHSTPKLINSSILDRLKTLENTLEVCNNGVVKNSEDLLTFQKQLLEVKNHPSYYTHDSLKEDKLATNVPVTFASSHVLNNNNNSTAIVQEDTLLNIMERLRRAESALEEIRQILQTQRDDLRSMYTKSQLDGRFESLWASFLALLTRKEDQETVDQKLTELRSSLTEECGMQIDIAVRELQRSIEERVSVTEVRELLRGMRD